jgi:hypothetical protein
MQAKHKIESTKLAILITQLKSRAMNFPMEQQQQLSVVPRSSGIPIKRRGINPNECRRKRCDYSTPRVVSGRSLERNLQTTRRLISQINCIDSQ